MLNILYNGCLTCTWVKACLPPYLNKKIFFLGVKGALGVFIIKGTPAFNDFIFVNGRVFTWTVVI
jgi:hypothetical protein